jgi:hypothetical protein
VIAFQADEFVGAPALDQVLDDVPGESTAINIVTKKNKKNP